MSTIPRHRVPAVVGVASIRDPVARNHAINQSYHAFGREMAVYQGSPLVSNWCTYGQHASREAGQQINNLQAGLKILKEARPILAGLSPGNPLGLVRTAKRIGPTIRRIVALLNEDGLMKQSLQLALTKARITQAEIDAVVAAYKESTTTEWSDFIPGARLLEDAELARRAVALGVKLGVATSAIIRAVTKVYENMLKGNKAIYENIAPAYNRFLAAAHGASNGVANTSRMSFAGDTHGFVKAAFTKYSEARVVANRIASTSASSALVADRNALAHEANLLIGYQEQLVILQPIFDTMQEELRSMNGTMVLRDPNGTHKLADNWGNFYSRMGIRPGGAPSNPGSIRSGRLPTLHAKGSRGARGTIAEYFERYLTDRRIHQAPPAIRAH